MNQDSIFWGSGNRTSSDSAFELNIMSEVARVTGQHSITVLMEMAECYETIRPDALLREAREA
eukprot:1149946-Pyramimonas_sp.AAC.1